MELGGWWVSSGERVVWRIGEFGEIWEGDLGRWVDGGVCELMVNGEW
jgi:hypothetical protein